MEQYFPFVTEAFSIFQYSAWALLFLITVWQLFRVFGGPVTEAENPWQLLIRSAIFALLIGYAKPIFLLALDIARRRIPPFWMLRWTREVYVRRRGASDPERIDHAGFHHNRDRSPIDHHPHDLPGLELLQNASGMRGAVCSRRRFVLHFPAGLRHGWQQDHQQCVQRLDTHGRPRSFCSWF